MNSIDQSLAQKISALSTTVYSSRINKAAFSHTMFDEVVGSVVFHSGFWSRASYLRVLSIVKVFEVRAIAAAVMSYDVWVSQRLQSGARNLYCPNSICFRLLWICSTASSGVAKNVIWGRRVPFPPLFRFSLPFPSLSYLSFFMFFFLSLSFL